MKLSYELVLVCALSVLGGYAAQAAARLESRTLSLHENWQIQTSRFVREGGEVISTSGYKPRNWYPATAPSTVLAALVADKVYADPYFGMNLRAIPGTQYPIGEGFSNLNMPPESPFGCSWWYRTEFRLPPGYEGKQLWLQFGGINFRANVWLNGERIADSRQMAGTFRSFEFNVSGTAKTGEVNVLAVETFPPQPHDLQINWVDVNPTPPDKNLGIWRPVRLQATGPVALRDANVVARLDLPAMDAAHLSVTVEVKNGTGQPVKGILRGRIEGIAFERLVEIEGGATRKVVFDPASFPQLNITNPRVWWPARLGPQNLYQAELEFVTQGEEVSDSETVTFGIRSVTSELTGEGHRLFRINGRRILIRGAGWWSDMLLRNSPDRQAWEVRYVQDLNLNAIRMDGKFEDENFLNLADKTGLMLMPGWCCCDHWERWNDWDDEDRLVSAESLGDVIRKFRTHPSVITWLDGDDNPPPPDVERRYTAVLEKNDWPNPWQTSATAQTTSVSGATGYKMTGPYMWVPPIYWYADKKHGGAFGFNTETSPSAAVPPVESIRKTLPDSHLWPVDEFWDYHGGGGEVFGGHDIREFTQALNSRLGSGRNLDDYAMKAQLMAYEAQRAMYEAYGRNKYVATGVLHEMLNSAWPSFIWNLYDYFLRPGGSYFGTKKACEPLHVQYSYDDRSVVVVNSLYQAYTGMRVTAEVYDLSLKKRFSKSATVQIDPDSSTEIFTIPDVTGITNTWFVRLVLEDAQQRTVSTNLYWLSTKPDEPDWDKTIWAYTPTKGYGDLRGLSTLPQAPIEARSEIRQSANGEDTVHVTLVNPGRNLAFFIRLKICKGAGGEEILPVLWQDNYVSLMPGETRTVTAVFAHKDLGAVPAFLEVEGWNVPKISEAAR